MIDGQVSGDIKDVTSLLRFVVIAPDVPFIYVPEADFIKLISVVGAKYADQNVQCSNFGNHCKFAKPCSQV